MKKIIILILLLSITSLMIFSCGNAEETKESDTADTQEAATEIEAEEIPAATEPVVTTEPEPTTEKPVIKYEIVKRFVFDNPNDIGWRATNHIKDFRVEDGVLKLTSIGGDPFFTAAQPLGIEASEIDIIRIRAKNMSYSDRCQFFFDTDLENGLSESKSYRGFYMYAESDPASDEWNEVIFYTDECDLWEGTIKTVRFDPSESEGDVFIEYISFERRVKE